MFNTKVKGYLAAIFSAIFYGFIPLFILPLKKLNYSTDTSLFYRFLIAALFLLVYLISSKQELKIKKNELLLLVILGTFYALSTEFLLIGYYLTSPGIASTILYAFPIIVATIMFCFFKEKLTKTIGISLVLSFIGVVVLSVKNTQFDFNALGLIVCLLSALFYALYLVIVSVKKISVSGLTLACYSLLFSSLYYGLKIVFTGGDFAIQSMEVFSTLILFALIPTVFSLATLIYAIKYIGSTKTSILGAFEPIVAVTVSVAIFGEQLTFNLIVGTVLIIIGVVICVLNSNKETETSDDSELQLIK